MEAASRAILTLLGLVLLINLIKGDAKRWLGYVLTGSDIGSTKAPKRTTAPVNLGRHGKRRSKRNPLAPGQLDQWQLAPGAIKGNQLAPGAVSSSQVTGGAMSASDLMGGGR